VQTFNSDGVEIAYLDEGSGDPVLLVHGFASNVATNWVDTGWVKTLTGAGYRVIAYDNRGHGHSEKLYRLEDYGAPIMAEDARRLLDHLGIKSAHVMGYSMGARISAFLAIAHPARVHSLVFGGLGINMVRGVAGTGPVAYALEAASIDEVTNPTARTFRAFAEQTKSDLKALAACIRGSRQVLTKQEVASITLPTLVSVGTNDDVSGSGPELAGLMPNATALDIPGRDHNLAVGDKVHKQGVLDFLARRP
jgi:pimeloyl-ACP methyl ester carboxylesterase